MNKTWMRIAFEYAAFLALSGDDALNQDTAVSQLERLASLLKSMPQADQRAFLDFVRNDAMQTARDEMNKELLAFCNRLPSDLGLSVA